MSERIIIAGSSGLIGSALADLLRAEGREVSLLVRREPRSSDEMQWDPDIRLDPALLKGAKALVNLGGASIGRLPWTKKYRQTLWNSRIQTTRTLATAIRELGADAPMFVSASAVGYYGHRPGETLTESASAGNTFLANLSKAWEAEALAAGKDADVALVRTAPVIHPQGVLKPLILLTKFGLGGPLGKGTQIWPWISLGDEVRAICHIIDQGITGPVNLSGPAVASANDTGRELARRLRRPFFIPAPGWALRLGLGRDAADSLLLADARVEPAVLTETGFKFTHTNIEEAITSAVLT